MKITTQPFLPLKQAPAKADTVNHRLLVQAGFVRQTMAGVYTYTEIGLAVLNKISAIVRKHMKRLDSAELHMPALHPSELWKKSGGWDNIDVLFHITSQTGKEYALGQSHEEVVTPLMAEVIKSYKDLPKSVFQIQWKFRDELRAKSGILRGREFLMKDMYSFHETHEDFLEYYERVKQGYLAAYRDMGLVAKATEASGGSFTDKKSYEFMVLTDAGEDDILYCDECDYCINVEIADGMTKCPHCGAKLKAARASEAGNIFDLGQHYSEIFDVTFTDSQNQKHFPYMGCYGIGISRCMGIIVEKCHDDQGIIWPESVAPADFHLIGVGEKGDQLAARMEEQLNANYPSIATIYDDRDITPGAKFAAADLIGCPYRLVFSDTLGDDLVEVKRRDGGETFVMTFENLEQLIQKHLTLSIDDDFDWAAYHQDCIKFLRKLAK